MKKYLLVETVNRETSVTVFDTKEQATKKLEKEYRETLFDIDETESWTDDETKCYINDTHESAYINNDMDYVCDLEVFEIDV